VDVTVQEARFTVKDQSQCTRQDVTKAIEGVGFTVANVKLSSASSKP
jgi:hypothetical protein